MFEYSKMEYVYDLPDELLEHVTDYLEAPALGRMARSSTRFREASIRNLKEQKRIRNLRQLAEVIRVLSYILSPGSKYDRGLENMNMSMMGSCYSVMAQASFFSTEIQVMKKYGIIDRFNRFSPEIVNQWLDTLLPGIRDVLLQEADDGLQMVPKYYSVGSITIRDLFTLIPYTPNMESVFVTDNGRGLIISKI